MQVGHEVEVGAGVRADTALQVGRRVEDEERMDDRAGSGSGSRDEQEYSMPQRGAALVRVQPIVGTVTAPSHSDHPSDETSSAFHLAGGGDTPSSGGPSSMGGTDTAAENGLRRSLLGLSVKLDKYDGTTCLETFLVSIRNFATYYRSSEKDELFCLRANLTGVAGQVLWNLSTQVTLEDLIRLLWKRFGSLDQAERFRTELHTRKRRPNETLQSFYNDICWLMSLAYPGPNSELVDVVGRDAFLEALGDPSLHVRILDKSC